MTGRPPRAVPGQPPTEPSLRGLVGCEGMLRAIAAEPWETLHRLVLADWLEENGHAVRARLIRLQEEEERWPGTHGHAIGRLLTDHGAAWREEGWLFRGGMLDGLNVTCGRTWWGRGVARARGEFDLRHIRILANPTGGYSLVHELTYHAAASSLCALTLPMLPDVEEHISALDQFPALESLAFEEQGATEGLYRRMAAHPWLGRVARLRLPERSHEGLGHLLSSPHIGALAELALARGARPGLADLASLGRLAGLSRLGLGACGLNDEALASLVRAGAAPRLRGLNLEDNDIGDPGLAFLSAGAFESLDHLNLAGNRFHERGVAALAAAPWASSLRRLDLTGNLVGDAGAERLLSGPLAGLESLGLGITGVGPATAYRLAAGALPRLRSLSLHACRLGDDAVAALARSPALANLTDLRLYDCDIGEAGALALAASPHLTQLAFLDIFWNPLGERGRAAILARWPSAAVEPRH